MKRCALVLKCVKLLNFKGKPQVYENLKSNNFIKYLNEDIYKYRGYEHKLTTNKCQVKQILNKKLRRPIRKSQGVNYQIKREL